MFKRVDYEKVLQLLFNEILKKKARVVEFVCDFEKAVWQSVRLVFGENVNIFGCGLILLHGLFQVGASITGKFAQIMTLRDGIRD